MPNQPSTVKLRRLAAELRALRAAAGLTQEQVCDRTRMSQVTLYRIESAQSRPQRRTLLTLLDLYGLTDEARRQELVDLSKTADQLGWLQALDDLDDEYRSLIGFEDAAKSARTYESLFVPGLLQIEDYVRAVVQASVPTADEDYVERRIQTRLKRQTVLTRPHPLQLWAILDEAVLTRLVGGSEVMARQISHMVESSGRPNVIIQILPFELGAHSSMEGSFLILDFPMPEDPAIAYVDSPAGDLFIERPADVERFRVTFEHLQAAALSPAASVRRMRSVAGRLAGKEGQP
jgi:transcriptional regulator with XRE-family HTH domain